MLNFEHQISCSVVTFVLCPAVGKNTKFAKLTDSNLFCLHCMHFSPTPQFKSKEKIIYCILLPFVNKSGLGCKGQIIFLNTDPSNSALNKAQISKYARLWYQTFAQKIIKNSAILLSHSFIIFFHSFFIKFAAFCV